MESLLALFSTYMRGEGGVVWDGGEGCHIQMVLKLRTSVSLPQCSSSLLLCLTDWKRRNAGTIFFKWVFP